MKQYWLHTKEAASGLGNNKDVGSGFLSIPEGNFSPGRFVFKSEGEEELVCFLWSLLLRTASRHRERKPHGFGRVEISLKQLNILDTAAMYDSGDPLLRTLPGRERTLQ